MHALAPALVWIVAATFALADDDTAGEPRMGVRRLLTGALSMIPVARAHGTDSTRIWTFTVEQRYGDRPGSELVDPSTLGVDGAGRLYVADSKPALIKVFNSDGMLLRTIGRQGGGPGEFRVPWIAVRGANLVVHDPAQSRTSVFDTSGVHLRTWQSFCCHQNEIALDNANQVVIPAVIGGAGGTASLSVRRISYARYRLDGTPIDTLHIRTPGEESLWTVTRDGNPGKPGGGYTSMNIPYTPRQLYAFHPAGGFVTGWSGTYHIARTTDGRDSALIVSRLWTSRRIPDRLRRAQVDTAISQFKTMVGEGKARQAVRIADVPISEPAFTRLLVDEDGYIWARRLLGGDATHTAFDVFAPTGAYEGQAVMPVAVPDWGGVYFGRGVLYVRSEGTDGQPIVVRLRVTRGQK